MRAITMGELWALYNEHKDWIEELRWRCSACHLSACGQTGPCCYCSSKDGQLQMRNLHEVVATIIRPACANTGTSYVEFLTRDRRLQDQRYSIPVETFVSHWWGEEFAKLIHTLDRYAAVRCAPSRNLKLVYATFVLSSSLVCVGHRYLVFAFASRDYHGTPWYAIDDSHTLCKDFAELINSISNWQDLRFGENFGEHLLKCASWSVILVSLVLFATAVVAICTRHKQRDPMTGGYWICAFANNQFEIAHALAQDSDVLTSAFAVALRSDSCTSVVAVLDGHGQIYQRIWCCFELFFVTTVLRSKFKRHLDVSLANKFGVSSMGDGTREQLNYLQAVIANVRTATAKATVEEDARVIGRALEDEQTTYEQLDRVLRDLAISGVKAVKRRAIAPLTISLFLPIAWFALHCTVESGLAAVIWEIIDIIEPDYKSWSLPYARKMICWFMAFISAYNILLWSARGCPAGVSSGLGSRRQTGRFTELIFVPFLPILMAELAYQVPMFLTTVLPVEWNAHYHLFAFSSQAVAIKGIVTLMHWVLCAILCSFGFSYYFGLRDIRAWSPLRQSLEDLLYNA